MPTVFGLHWALSILFAVALCQNAGAQVADGSTSSQIRIVSPVDGTVFKAPATISVQVEGSDVPNVGHVISLYENGTLLHALVLDPLIPITLNPVSFSFDFDWNDVRAGRYILTAKIDDVSSDPVTVVVKRRRSKRR